MSEWGQPPPGGGGGWGAPPPQQQQQGGWGQMQPQYAQPQPGGATPGRAAGVGETFANFTSLLKRPKGGLFVAWLLLSVANLVLQVPRWIIAYLQQSALMTGDFRAVSTYGTATLCSSGFYLVMALLISGMLIGLYGPMRQIMITGAPAGGAGEVLKAASGDLLSKIAVMLLLGLAIGIGAIFCIIPGLLAAFFLGMAPYLVAACGVSV